MSADSTRPTSAVRGLAGAELGQSTPGEVEPAARGVSRFVYPAVAIAVSSVFLVESIGLGFGTLQTPGAGLWPFSIAAITIVLSLIQALVPGAVAATPEETTGVGVKPHTRALLLGGLIIIYAIFIDAVGYLILTAVLVLVASLFVARARWWGAALTAVVTTGLVYMVFATFLGIPLPAWPAV